MVAFHELDETRTGRPLVVDWLDGVTLHELIGRSGPLPPARALQLFAQLATALEVIHGRGIVHGDPRHVDAGRAKSHTVTSQRAPG